MPIPETQQTVHPLVKCQSPFRMCKPSGEFLVTSRNVFISEWLNQNLVKAAIQFLRCLIFPHVFTIEGVVVCMPQMHPPRLMANLECLTVRQAEKQSIAKALW